MEENETDEIAVPMTDDPEFIEICEYVDLLYF
jgi:hypothetical protein